MKKLAFLLAVFMLLCSVSFEGAKMKGAKKIAIAGGVAANGELRRAFSERAEKEGMQFFLPPPNLCTDNGAMISCAGYYDFISGKVAPLSQNAVATLRLI